MNRFFLLFLLLVFVFPDRAGAHIGSPNVVFEGDAGPYPVRVIIRPPGVVPGLAEITVRLRTNGTHRVTVLPVHWRAGEEGAPPPDEARPVRGNPDLYSTELWLMTVGSYSVYVNVEGDHGKGTAIVPVASIATEPRRMPRLMGAGLLSLVALLFIGGVAIIGAAIRESVLPPGALPSRLRIWGARGAMLISAAGLSLALLGGWSWWSKIERNYRNNRLYKSINVSADFQTEGGERILRLNLDSDNWARRGPRPLVPDHGKLMHMFMVREPELDVLAHLHPVQRNATEFAVTLPPLPAGSYRLYADITEESGLPHTLTTVTDVPALPSTQVTKNRLLQPDPDDSWHQDSPDASPDAFLSKDCDLGDGHRMRWLTSEEEPRAEENVLRFKVVDATGELALLDPYMGMIAHAAIRKKDGSVFAHLHPSGTISVASQQVFQLRSQGKTPKVITAAALEPFCKNPTLQERRQVLSFPYEFPRPGEYRIWIQVKIRSAVKTAVFDTVIP